VSRWPLVGLAAAAAGAAVGAEWMRAPGLGLALALVWLAALAVLAARRPGVRTPRGPSVAAALALVLLAAAALAGTWRLHQLSASWPAVRERAITRASRGLGGELDRAVALARRLAEDAVALADAPGPQAFAALRAGLERDAPLHGVVLFDESNRAWAWAGAQRVVLDPRGPELEALTPPFYLWLVARRQTRVGTAVAAVLVARDEAVPAGGASLAERFQARTGVGLRFLDPRAAPADPDVFDYVQPQGSGDTLFAVGFIPPDQGAMRSAQEAWWRRAALWLVGALLLAASVAAVRGPLPLWLRATPFAAALIALARAPLKEAFGAGSIFWPSTYYSGLLEPFSSSAGVLGLLGLLAAAAGCALWRAGLKPTAATRVIAVLGTLVAPYLLQDLARGITPPAQGVPVTLWLVWQGALTLSAAALVLLAAALVRGRELPVHAGRWPWLAGAIAVTAAIAGLWLWDPVGAWPEWYPYLWLPALLIVLRPMPFRAVLATIAIVAGTAAALLTWGAAAEGRMDLAGRDLENLGERTDPLAVALLERLVLELPLDPPPRLAGDLFVLWRTSALGGQGYPAALAVWSGHGDREVSLELGQLTLSGDVVRDLAVEAQLAGLPRVRHVSAVPGPHSVAAIPLADGRVLTVAVGPRSRLVPPTRVGRFLTSEGTGPFPPYDIALAPAVRGTAGPRVEWTRDGWRARGERTLDLVGGARHAHALVELGGPSSLLQRGALVLAIDVGLLGLLWLLVAAVEAPIAPGLRAWWLRARRSLRLRLSVSLAAFFVVPNVAFAVWSYARIETEFRGDRALLLQRTLLNAAGLLADTLPDGTPVVSLSDAARRSDAPLALAVDGRITAVSAPVLLNLGLLDRLVDGRVYARFAYGDELEAASDQPASPVPTLIGYRLLARAPATVVLAAPEFLTDPALRRREADLGIAVLVAALAGCVAALVLSGLAARALARPLQQLRAAALAVGTGEAPPPAGEVPTELEPIAGALAQAAADVEKGQKAQRVLAWGEMARQVAHEIKNPLTPIRLGIQHLLRIQRDQPGAVGPVLTGTGERILAEIDRLDAIARAFSRFALPTNDTVPVEPVDVEAVVRDVVHLYRVGEGPIAWTAEAQPGLTVFARRDELVEVLVNLCENARNAAARTVVVAAHVVDGGALIEVRDDGRGIPPEVLARVFEPRFSTTTSGSGLGLAIAKRMVESWGGTIALGPRPDGGTAVRIRLNVVGDPGERHRVGGKGRTPLSL